MPSAFVRFSLHQPANGDGLARFQVAVENNAFSGQTLVWGYAESFAELAGALRGLPQTANSQFSYKLRTSKAGYCKLEFVCVDGSGHTALWVSLESEYSVFPSAEH